MRINEQMIRQSKESSVVSTKRRNRRMPTTSCIDPVVGAILSGWRYDISGLSPDMRTDYESHLCECQHCRSKERLHRTIDVLLISVSTLSIMAFLLAVSVIHPHRRSASCRRGSHAASAHARHHLARSGCVRRSLLLDAALDSGCRRDTSPGFLGSIVRSRIPADRLPANLRDRITKNHA